MSGFVVYFIFSLLLALLGLLHVVNMFWYFKTDRNIAGEKVTRKSIGYKKYKWYISKKGITVAALALIILIANLVNSIRMVKVHIPGGSTIVRTGSIIILITVAITIIAVKEKLNRYKNGKTTRKDKHEPDSHTPQW